MQTLFIIQTEHYYSLYFREEKKQNYGKLHSDAYKKKPQLYIIITIDIYKT